jgi:hypothetical protein
MASAGQDGQSRVTPAFSPSLCLVRGYLGNPRRPCRPGRFGMLLLGGNPGGGHGGLGQGGRGKGHRPWGWHRRRRPGGPGEGNRGLGLGCLGCLPSPIAYQFLPIWLSANNCKRRICLGCDARNAGASQARIDSLYLFVVCAVWHVGLLSNSQLVRYGIGLHLGITWCGIC